MKKKTIEEARAVFEENGLKLLEDNYKEVNTPMKCMDEKGYLYYRSFHTVTDKRGNNNYKHLFSLRNKFYWENIQRYMETEVDTKTTLLTNKNDYVNGDTKISFLCGRCSCTFKMSLHSFIGSKYKICPTCYKEIFKNTETVEKRKNKFVYYENIAKSRNLKILSKRIENFKDKIVLEDNEGYRGKMSISAFVRGSNFERYSIRNPYTIYNMQNFINKNREDSIVLPQEFKSDKAMMNFKCSCGNIYKTSLTHFINDKKFKCNQCRCRQSKIAKIVEDYLISIQIKYDTEKTFLNCMGDKGRPLFFDFYLPNYNACIEVDGIQHYKPIPFDGNKIKAKKDLAKRQKYDGIKNNYCKNNNIHLLRLPFWEIENQHFISLIEDFFLSIKSNDLGK